MLSDTVNDIVQFLDVLHTSVSEKTGRILAQVGSVVGRTVDGVNAEWWQHVGFVSRPSKPQAGKVAARSIGIRTGSIDAIVASEDDRGVAIKGNLGDGETCVYAAGEDGTAQGRIVIKKDGSVNLYTTDTNADDGKSVYFRVASDGFMWVAPWGTIKFDATGFHLLHLSGASFDLGGIFGMPSPLDQIASYCRIQAGSFNATASSHSFGDGTPVPLADAQKLQTILLGIVAQLALASTGPIVVPPPIVAMIPTIATTTSST